MSLVTPPRRLTLHTSYRSSSSARLRIALRLKSLPVHEIYVDLLSDQQFSSEHRALNPRMSIPVLQDSQTSQAFPITQSVAALEYLEEAFPHARPLLPPLSEPLERAKVRTLVNLMVADIQPFTQIRVTKKIETFGGDAVVWQSEITTQGLEAVEQILQRTAGRYAVGDSITLADACLVPAIWNAEKLEINLEPWPAVRKVYENLNEEPAIMDAHWRRQPDTPREMRREGRS